MPNEDLKQLFPLLAINEAPPEIEAAVQAVPATPAAAPAQAAPAPAQAVPAPAPAAVQWAATGSGLSPAGKALHAELKELLTKPAALAGTAGVVFRTRIDSNGNGFGFDATAEILLGWIQQATKAGLHCNGELLRTQWVAECDAQQRGAVIVTKAQFCSTLLFRILQSLASALSCEAPDAQHTSTLPTAETTQDWLKRWVNDSKAPRSWSEVRLAFMKVGLEPVLEAAPDVGDYEPQALAVFSQRFASIRKSSGYPAARPKLENDESRTRQRPLELTMHPGSSSLGIYQEISTSKGNATMLPGELSSPIPSPSQQAASSNLSLSKQSLSKSTMQTRVQTPSRKARAKTTACHQMGRHVRLPYDLQMIAKVEAKRLRENNLAGILEYMRQLFKAKFGTISNAWRILTAFSKDKTMSREDLIRGLNSAEKLILSESDFNRLWEEIVLEAQLERGKHKLSFVHFSRAFSTISSAVALHRTAGSKDSGGDSASEGSGSFVLSSKGPRVCLKNQAELGWEPTKGASFKNGRRANAGQFMAGAFFGCLQDEAQHMDPVTLRRAIFLGLAIDFRHRWRQVREGYPSMVAPPSKGMPSMRERHEIFQDSIETLMEEWDSTASCGAHPDMKDFIIVEYSMQDDWTKDVTVDGNGFVSHVEQGGIAARWGIERGHKVISVGCSGEWTPSMEEWEERSGYKTRVTFEPAHSKAHVAIEEMCQSINRGGNYDPWADVVKRRGCLFDGSTHRPFSEGQKTWMWEALEAHSTKGSSKVSKEQVQRALARSFSVLPSTGEVVEALWRLAVREHRGGASAAWCDDLVGRAGSKHLHLDDEDITCSSGTGSTRFQGVSEAKAWMPEASDTGLCPSLNIDRPWIEWNFSPELRCFCEVWTRGIRSFRLQYHHQHIWHDVNRGEKILMSEIEQDGIRRASLEPTFDAEMVRMFAIDFDPKDGGLQATFHGYVLVPRFLHDHRCQITFVTGATAKHSPTKRISASQRNLAPASYKVARTVGEALHLGATHDDLFRDYWLGTLRVSRIGYSDAARAPFTEGAKSVAQVTQIGARGNPKPVQLRLMSCVAKFVASSTRVKELDDSEALAKCDKCGGTGHTAEIHHIVNVPGFLCRRWGLPDEDHPKGRMIGCGGMGHETRHCPNWHDPKWAKGALSKQHELTPDSLCLECNTTHENMIEPLSRFKVPRCYHCLGVHPDTDEHPVLNHFLATYAPCTTCGGLGHTHKVCPRQELINYQDFMRLYSTFAIHVVQEIAASSGYTQATNRGSN